MGTGQHVSRCGTCSCSARAGSLPDNSFFDVQQCRARLLCNEICPVSPNEVGPGCRSAPVARRQDYDYLIKLLLIGDSGG